jgi:quinolinate synthase
MTRTLFDFTRQDARGACSTAQAWAKVPVALTPPERTALKARAAELLKQHNAVLVAHYYVDGDLQDLALETGGCVSDSLEMARFGRDHAARTLVVAGVRGPRAIKVCGVAVEPSSWVWRATAFNEIPHQ